MDKDTIINLFYIHGSHKIIKDMYGYTDGQYDFMLKKMFGKTGNLKILIEKMKLDKFNELMKSGETNIQVYLNKMCIKNKSSLTTFIKRYGFKISDINGNRITKKVVNTEIINDSDFMSYFAGFVAADGNLDANRNRIKICLHKQDKDILDKLKNKIFINRDDVKLYVTKEDYLELHITSDEIYKYMLNLGITPCKTQTLNLNIENVKNIKSFMRGYFDGDGCLSVIKRHVLYQKEIKTYYRINFIGNFDTMSKFKKIFLENNIDVRLSRENSEKYSFPFYKLLIVGSTGTNIKDFVNFIYEDNTANIYMNRKYNKLMCF